MYQRCRLYAKLKISSLSPLEVYESISLAPKLGPDAFLRELKKTSLTTSPDVQLLEALSARFLTNSEEFFPPQILESLTLFAECGFSNEKLFEAFTGRANDILANPSPRRITTIISLFSKLNLPLFNPHFWTLFRPHAINNLPHMTSRLVSICAALANQGCVDETFLTGIFTRLEICHQSGVLDDLGFLRGCEKIACMHSGNLADLIFSAVEPINGDLTVELLKMVILHRLGKEALEVDAGNISNHEHVINLASEAVSLGVFSPRLAEEVFARLERISPLKNSRSFIRGIDAAAKLAFSPSTPSPAVPLFIQKLEIGNLSSKRLLTLLRANHLSLGVENSSIEELINVKQLTLKEKRLLWDISEKCEASPFPPLLPPGNDKKMTSRVVGPHVLLNKTIFAPTWKLKCSNDVKRIRPDAWLTLQGLKRRGVAAEFQPI